MASQDTPGDVSNTSFIRAFLNSQCLRSTNRRLSGSWSSKLMDFPPPFPLPLEELLRAGTLPDRRGLATGLGALSGSKAANVTLKTGKFVYKQNALVRNRIETMENN